jgi:hypothetical protein
LLFDDFTNDYTVGSLWFLLFSFYNKCLESPPKLRFEKLRFCFRRFQKDRNENGNQDGMQDGNQDGMQDGNQDGMQDGNQDGMQDGNQDGMKTEIKMECKMEIKME